ncbi:hypothetical protein GCM10009020_10990 [Natronoarchaeum mannanilyticum]|uniref:Uncharacterized protein n=1 Tax=Natronoarchaeum mannanilyticum TaxID=926360 RepID=A0AAV3T8D0_9EURY
MGRDAAGNSPSVLGWGALSVLLLAVTIASGVNTAKALGPLRGTVTITTDRITAKALAPLAAAEPDILPSVG